MKTVKYLILSLFTVVVLATATELFRAYCLADEPTGSLDADNAAKVVGLLLSDKIVTADQTPESD